MAAKKKTETEIDIEGPQEAPITETAPPAEGGMIPGTVRIHNLTRGAIDITLTDATNVRLGPWTRNGTGNVSAPIPKKLLPPAVRQMAAGGLIRIEEARP